MPSSPCNSTQSLHVSLLAQNKTSRPLQPVPRALFVPTTPSVFFSRRGSKVSIFLIHRPSLARGQNARFRSPGFGCPSRSEGGPVFCSKVIVGNAPREPASWRHHERRQTRKIKKESTPTPSLQCSASSYRPLGESSLMLSLLPSKSRQAAREENPASERSSPGTQRPPLTQQKGGLRMR